MSKTPFSFAQKSPLHKLRQGSPSKGIDEQIELHFSQFMKDVTQWRQLHDSSVEALSEYISTVNLLSPEIQSFQNDQEVRSLQIIAKLEKSHHSLVQLVESHYILIASMKQLIQRCKKQINEQIQSQTQFMKHVIDRGSYNNLLCPLDYIDIMTQYISMFDEELDVKTVILQSLNEQETVFVLNTYLITWKKQPFYDSATIRQIEMRMNMNEKMKNKI